MRKRLRKAIIVGEHLCGVAVMTTVIYAAVFLHLYSERKKETLNNYQERTV